MASSAPPFLHLATGNNNRLDVPEERGPPPGLGNDSDGAGCCRRRAAAARPGELSCRICIRHRAASSRPRAPVVIRSTSAVAGVPGGHGPELDGVGVHRCELRPLCLRLTGPARAGASGSGRPGSALRASHPQAPARRPSILSIHSVP